MSIAANQYLDPTTTNRRSFFSGVGKITLSATAIALLAGADRVVLVGSAGAQTPSNDVAILNAALAAE
jgi:nucleoside phosphorylase